MEACRYEDTAAARLTAATDLLSTFALVAALIYSFYHLYTSKSRFSASLPESSSVDKEISVRPSPSLTDSLVPTNSTYYVSPFFADSIVSKSDFLDILTTMGGIPMEDWILVQKTRASGKHRWKKYFASLSYDAQLRLYSSAEAARRKIDIKSEFFVHAVKPADPHSFGPRALLVKSSAGVNYLLKADDDAACRLWLCLLTKRASERQIHGRRSTFVPDRTEASNSSHSGLTEVDAPNSEATDTPMTPELQSHTLNVTIENLSDFKGETSRRQFYAVISFESETHSYEATIPVGQTIAKSLAKKPSRGVFWDETLTWHFHDHPCHDCTDCQSAGATSGAFSGVPERMVIHLHELKLRCISTKVGELTLSLRDLLEPYGGVSQFSRKGKFPIFNMLSHAPIGHMSLGLDYALASEATATVQPFLVTSADERELMGEFPIGPHVADCLEFFTLCFADGSHEKWDEFYRIREDSEMEVGEWKVSAEHGGMTREIRFRSMTNASIGPASTMATTEQHVHFKSVADADPERFVLEKKTQLHDIPYGDCFHVEEVWEVSNTPDGTNALSGHLTAKVYVGVPFSKGCMFKSKIIPASKEGTTSSATLFMDLLNRTDEEEEGEAPSSVQPFLMTTDMDEFYVVGDFQPSTKLTSATQFFDVLYNSEKSDRVWQGVYRVTGDSDHHLGSWEKSDDYGGLVRRNTFKQQTNAAIGPSSTNVIQDQHAVFEEEESVLKLETKLHLQDIPYGDHFHVETMYIVRAVEEVVHVKVYLAVVFTKSTMWKSKILAATRDGTMKSTRVIFEEIGKMLDTLDDVETPNEGHSVRFQEDKDRASTASNGQKRRLTRFDSTLDGSVALEEIFENQRVNLFGKWGPNHLLPTDRGRFTNRFGDAQLSFDKMQPPPGWMWTTPWKVDRNYTDCDEDGWSYASDFPRFKTHLERGKSSSKRLGASVRRRRWIRMMAYVPVEEQDDE